MTELETALRGICADLANSGHPFALVGGLAVSVRTQPRFTQDADLAVSVLGDAEAEALIRALGDLGYALQATVEQDAVGRLATARLMRPLEAPSPVIDLLFASSGIEPELVAEAEVLEVLPDLRLSVATVAYLIALKVLARDDISRPQDIADLRALLAVASDTDLEAAGRAIDLITERGFHRRRDLRRELNALLPASR